MITSNLYFLLEILECSEMLSRKQWMKNFFLTFSSQHTTKHCFGLIVKSSWSCVFVCFFPDFWCKGYYDGVCWEHLQSKDIITIWENHVLLCRLFYCSMATAPDNFSQVHLPWTAGVVVWSLHLTKGRDLWWQYHTRNRIVQIKLYL